MTIVFCYWGSFNNGAERDAIRCAVARAECPVIVVSEQPCNVDGAEWLPIQSFNRAGQQYRSILARVGPYKWKGPTLARWLVLNELVEQRPEISFPIANLDWDVLLFSPFADAYAPFMGCDWSISAYHEGVKLERSAAYVVNHPAVMAMYCEYLTKKIADAAPWGEDFQDMRCWSELADVAPWADVGNLFEIHGNAVWDHNIAVCDGRFEADATGYKRVEFAEGTPYFVGLDGVPVKAHTAHCWGNYKTKTAELLKRAGIT